LVVGLEMSFRRLDCYETMLGALKETTNPRSKLLNGGRQCKALTSL